MLGNCYRSLNSASMASKKGDRKLRR